MDMKSKILFLLLIGILFIGTPAKAEETEPCTNFPLIKGIVSYPDGSPATEATVTAYVNGMDSGYVISGLSSGGYAISPGNVPKSGSVEVTLVATDKVGYSLGSKKVTIACGETKEDIHIRLSEPDSEDEIFCGGGVKCECGDVLISSHTMDYDLENCSGTGGILVDRAGIILDCAGHIINGTGSGSGIYLHSKTKNTIRNCTINGFEYGIHLYSSKNNSIINSTITSNDYGVYILGDSIFNKLMGNEISNNTYGVFFKYDGYFNDLTSNTICSNTKKDIYDLGSNSDSVLDNNNTCDTTHNWNDYGSIKCTDKCTGDEYDSEQLVCFWMDCINQQCSAFNPEPQYNRIMVHDYNYLMESYRCFLGLNQNCNQIIY